MATGAAPPDELTNQILGALREIATRRGIDCEIGVETEIFNELGLDSFAFAELVLILEQRTGRDPFTTSDQVVPILDVADLVRVYSAAPPSVGQWSAPR